MQAGASRDAAGRLLYSLLFDWIVERLTESISGRHPEVRSAQLGTV